ncbi:MAG: serine hydrolase [Enterobacterales bacterium]|nr:serine hydrolase [Enterobacterales bacterium]
MKTNQSVITTFIVLFICILSAVNVRASSDIEQISKIINYKLNTEKLGVGVAVAVFDGEKTEFLNFGLSHKNPSQMVNSDTLFEIGSITKTFTATALASMVNEGLIKLDDPIQKYLPKEVTVPVKNDKPITFMSLATHKSGLPRLATNMPFADPQDPYADYSVELLYAFLNNHELAHEVGTHQEYSNLGFGLLGHVMALIDNKSYEQMIYDRVLKPLNMSNTFIDIPEAKQVNLSDGHDGELNKAKHWDLGSLDGAGAIKSNIKDMSLYLMGNIRTKPLHDEFTFIQNMTKELLPTGNGIGMTWVVNREKNANMYMHDGGTGGFRSFIGFDNETKKGIVILANSVFEMNAVGYHYLAGSLDSIKLEAPKIIELSPEQLSKLNGQFELVPNFILTITNEGNQLFVQATNQPRFSLDATSNSEFTNKALKLKIVFDIDEAGNATSLVLYQSGQVLPGKKL